VTQPRTEARPRGPTPDDAPREALVMVVENATALAKAELRLAAAEGRAWMMKAGLGLGLLWLTLLLTQVFALTVVLSPLVLSSRPWPVAAAMLLASIIPLGLVGTLTLRELRSLRDVRKDLEPGEQNEHGQPQQH
jgi:hypothetical protein